MFCELSKADIDFPVNLDLKIIVVKGEKEGGYEKELAAVLSSIDIFSISWREKPSSKGTYISYTVNVDVKTRQQFDEMYEVFKDIEYVKTVI